MTWAYVCLSVCMFLCLRIYLCGFMFQQSWPNKLSDAESLLQRKNQLPPCQSNTETEEIGRYIKCTLAAVYDTRKVAV